MVRWWRDVIREGRPGHHTAVVSMGLRFGMALFIASEVMFFSAFFWAFFGRAVHPMDVADSAGRRAGIHPFAAWDIPFLNTLILLLSGCTVTWAHHRVREDDNATAIQGAGAHGAARHPLHRLQAYEYVHTPLDGFTISSGIFGSTFFMATGFHGFHVIIGTSFLIVCTVRAWYGQFRPDQHFGLEAAAWYWHFVDVVWLFLFVCIYWWGGTIALADH